MVIYKVNVERLGVLETKNHAPVRTNLHSPIAFEFALQRVQSERRQAHRVDRLGGVQRS
jgi:hypothetical protein